MFLKIIFFQKIAKSQVQNRGECPINLNFQFDTGRSYLFIWQYSRKVRHCFWQFKNIQNGFSNWNWIVWVWADDKHSWWQQNLCFPTLSSDIIAENFATFISFALWCKFPEYAWYIKTSSVSNRKFKLMGHSPLFWTWDMAIFWKKIIFKNTFSAYQTSF